MQPVAVILLDVDWHKAFTLDDPELEQARKDHPGAICKFLVYEERAAELLAHVLHSALGFGGKR